MKKAIRDKNMLAVLQECQQCRSALTRLWWMLDDPYCQGLLGRSIQALETYMTDLSAGGIEASMPHRMSELQGLLPYNEAQVKQLTRTCECRLDALLDAFIAALQTAPAPLREQLRQHYLEFCDIRAMILQLLTILPLSLFVNLTEAPYAWPERLKGSHPYN
jgi:hypothetical protein